MVRKKMCTLSIVSVLLVLSLLVGCSGNVNTPPVEAKPTESTQPTKTPEVTETEKVIPNFNATGFPIVQEPIKLHMVAQSRPQHGDWNEMSVLHEYAKITGIEVEYEVYPMQGFEEKKNLIFASGELPDAFISSSIGPAQQLKYGTTGMLIPLEDLIEEYGTNFKALLNQYPDITKTITSPNGHIVSLPGIVTEGAARSQKAWINKEHLAIAGVEVPKTTEELYQALKAIKAAVPDAVPLAIPFGGRPNFFSPVMVRGMAGVFGLDHQLGTQAEIVDGKVKIWLTDERLRAMIEYLHRLYKENLLYNDSFSLVSTDYDAMRKAGKISFSIEQADNNWKQGAAQPMAYPETEFGKPKALSGPVARDLGAFSITNKNKYPEASMRWVDYFYGEEGSYFLRYGIEGVTCIKNPDGTYQYTEEILNSPQGVGRAMGQHTIWPGTGAPHWINEKNSTAVTSPLVLEAHSLIQNQIPKAIYGALIMPEDISEEYIPLNEDISKYYTETLSRFLLEGITDAGWNEYTKTMEQLGMKKIENWLQELFDK